MTFARTFEWPVFFLIFTLALWLMKPSAESSHVFKGDDLRYISYAVSLHKYGVFGLADNKPGEVPEPSNANAPFYPALMAGVMALDQNFADSLICVTEEGVKAKCAQHFDSFFFVQVVLAVLSLFLIYLTALQLSKNRAVGWLAAVLALASGVFDEFSYIFMTEILILPFFCALTLTCLLVYQDKRKIWIFVSAVLLAFLTLIRPSYLYLFYGFVLFFGVLVLLKRDQQTLLKFLILVLGFVLTVSPWALRNKAQFDSLTLTSGGYAEAILVQRINYNQMSWPEVGVAMIYWLPDFGDSLAKKMFPEHLHNKLGWHGKSYYAQQYKKQVRELSEQLGGADKILTHLIKEDILTPKHIAVSIPLALRGTFIAKYWGLLGFIAFIALLVQSLRRKDYSVLIMSLPLFYMVAFHAGLSVSIPRYNLPLISLYALCMAWYINLYGTKFIAKFKPE